MSSQSIESLSQHVYLLSTVDPVDYLESKQNKKDDTETKIRNKKFLKVCSPLTCSNIFHITSCLTPPTFRATLFQQQQIKIKIQIFSNVGTFASHGADTLYPQWKLLK